VWAYRKSKQIKKASLWRGNLPVYFLVFAQGFNVEISARDLVFETAAVAGSFFLKKVNSTIM